jgi:outer membrane protein assembly factor BamB
MYLANTGGIVQALDARTGKLIWEHLVGADVAPRGIALYRNMLIFHSMERWAISKQDAFLVALDARTGRRVWTRRFPQPDFGCATAGRGIVFTSTFDGTVYGLDARNGSTIWRARTGAGINACPALAGDKLLVAAGVPLPGRRAYELVAYGPGGG